MYSLNGLDLSYYGISPGQISGSNIAMSGIFDMPSRIGNLYREWADENSVEPYVDADELFYGGRDIVFCGLILGTNGQINTYIQALYDAVEAFTDLVILSTPYGNFSVMVKTIAREYYLGVCRIIITFREPVVTLTGGSLPAVASSAYKIDGIPLLSFGLYYSKGSGVEDLSELKEQLFTKYGAEGYQMTRRKMRTFGINATLMGSSLADFQNKVKALYAIFKSAGLRTIIINNNISIKCFAVEGFEIKNLRLNNSGLYGEFHMNLICTKVAYVTADSTLITADNTLITADAT